MHLNTVTCPKRLQALKRLHLLDTEPEERFDRICRIASKLLNTPIAYVSLLDDTRQFFKSAVGLPGVTNTPREDSFCRFTIDGKLSLYVPDAIHDQRFSNNPYVKGPPGVRCYLGEPLFTCDGYAVGTFCILDTKPRELENEERALFKDLAALAERELNLLTRLHQQRKLTELTSRLATSMEALEVVEMLISTLQETVSFERAAVAVKKSDKMAVVYSVGGVLLDTVFEAETVPEHCFVTPFQNAIRLPIGYNDQLLGWLWLERGHDPDFSVAEVDLILTFVSQVGLILENRQILMGVFEQNRLASIGSLAAGVAHEINSPLGAARLGVESALASLQDPCSPMARKLERVNKSIQSASHIVRDILQFAGEGPNLTSTSELTAVCRQVLSLLHHELHQSETTVTVELQGVHPVNLGPKDLQTILHHLVQNASWAVRQPGCERRLHIEVARRGDRVTLSVEDSGCGIEAEIANRVFDPFFTTKQPSEGMGLGLSVSRRLARSVGGELELVPSSAYSTRMELTLPLSTTDRDEKPMYGRH